MIGKWTASLRGSSNEYPWWLTVSNGLLDLSLLAWTGIVMMGAATKAV